jgi:hypothetical protein
VVQGFDGLGGVGEQQAGADLADLAAADFAAAVAVVGGAVVAGDIPPGELVEVAGQAGLGGRDEEQVVGPGIDHASGGAGLGVQRVGGDDCCGRVAAGQQGRDRGDLMACGRGLLVSDHDLVMGRGRGERGHDGVGGAAAAQSRAVYGRSDGGRPFSGRRVGLRAGWCSGGHGREVAAGHPVQGVAVQPARQAAHSAGRRGVRRRDVRRGHAGRGRIR